jgi:hypothetical protein
MVFVRPIKMSWNLHFRSWFKIFDGDLTNGSDQMKRILFVLLLALFFHESVGQSVDLSGTANAFLNLLSADVQGPNPV